MSRLLAKQKEKKNENKYKKQMQNNEKTNECINVFLTLKYDIISRVIYNYYCSHVYLITWSFILNIAEREIIRK